MGKLFRALVQNLVSLYEPYRYGQYPWPLATDHEAGRATAQGMMDYRGQCHCGALQVHYQTRLPPQQWEIRTCSCTFCRIHAARFTSDPEGRLILRVTAARYIGRYHFGLNVVDFLFCNNCAVCIGALLTLHEGRYAVINTNVLTDLQSELPDAAPAAHENETMTARVLRQKSQWTPVM